MMMMMMMRAVAARRFFVVATASALLFVFAITFVDANGKGPIGVYAISRRYALTADSNIDALVTVDLYRGGAVGWFRLHGADDNVVSILAHKNKSYVGGKDKSVEKNWIDPTGIASCDSCRYIYLTSTHGKNFYQIELETSLLEMAENGNFDALSRGKLMPVWPWNMNATGVGEPTSSVRMLEVHRSGSIGYMAHRTYGLLRFFLDEEGRINESTGDVLLGMDDLGTPDGVVAGLTLTGNDEETLLVTASRSSLIVNLPRFGEENAVLEQVVKLQDICGTGQNMWFRDTAIVSRGSNLYLYTIGLFTPGQDGRGMALYHLTQNDHGQWVDCVNVAGPRKERGGWRDGDGKTARFTRPHEFTLLPKLGTVGTAGMTSVEDELDDILVLSDCDNRALRSVKLVPEQVHHVSTIQYYVQDDWWPTTSNKPDVMSNKNNLAMIDSGVTVQSNFGQVESQCQNNSDGVCTLVDIRNGLNTGSIQDDISIWTSDSCLGCWLRFPGICEGEIGGWDQDYRILATVAKGQIRMECIQEDTMTAVGSVCCTYTEEQGLGGPIHLSGSIIGKEQIGRLFFLCFAAFSLLLLLLLCTLSVTFRFVRHKIQGSDAGSTYNVVGQLT